MQAMLARVTEPVAYQAFQHFITHAPWDADRVWRRLRAVLPERQGIFILDGTSLPKQGTHSVGVARQYCGALGKIANCQVAVTAALWTHLHAYVLGAALYLPEEWLTAEARARARVPRHVVFQEKWRLALTLLRQVRASGFTVTACSRMPNLATTACFAACCIGCGCPMPWASRRTSRSFSGRPASSSLVQSRVADRASIRRSRPASKRGHS